MPTTLVIYCPTTQPTAAQRAQIARLFGCTPGAEVLGWDRTAPLPEGTLATVSTLPARTPKGARLVTLGAALDHIKRAAQQ